MAGFRFISDGDGGDGGGGREGDRARADGMPPFAPGQRGRPSPRLPPLGIFWVKSGLLRGSINQVEGNDAAASHQSALV